MSEKYIRLIKSGLIGFIVLIVIQEITNFVAQMLFHSNIINTLSEDIVNMDFKVAYSLCVLMIIMGLVGNYIENKDQNKNT